MTKIIVEPENGQIHTTPAQVARLEEAVRTLVEACRTALEDCEAALAGDWEPDDDGFEATANVLRQALARAEALWPGVGKS